MGYSLPGSSVHGILQARILERVVSPFFRESSWPRDWTRISCIVDGFFTIWANRQALQSYIYILCHWKITYKTPNCRNFYVTCLYFRVNFLTQTPVLYLQELMGYSSWIIHLQPKLIKYNHWLLLPNKSYLFICTLSVQIFCKLLRLNKSKTSCDIVAFFSSPYLISFVSISTLLLRLPYYLPRLLELPCAAQSNSHSFSLILPEHILSCHFSGKADSRDLYTVILYLWAFKLWAFKDANVHFTNIRCEWNCSLPSISYCWWSFSSTISHLLSFLQSVTLLACSLSASPCMPIVLYNCTFQGTKF